MSAQVLIVTCCLNLVASCLDDEDALPLKVSSFSVWRTALLLIVLHSLVRSVFWSMVSTNTIYVCTQMRSLCLSLSHAGSITDVISSGHQVQYICWYMFMEYVSEDLLISLAICWTGTLAQGCLHFLSVFIPVILP